MSFAMYQRKDIFAYIVRYKQSHDGNSPTLRQIASEFGMGSPSVANNIVRNLIKEGKLEKRDGKIEVVGGFWEFKVNVGKVG